MKLSLSLTLSIYEPFIVIPTSCPVAKSRQTFFEAEKTFEMFFPLKSDQ